VTGNPNIRFYAGTPLHSADGHALGTLCVIDRKPRTLSAEDRQCLRDLADCAEEQINARELAIHYRELELELELEQQNESLVVLNQLVDLVPGGLYQFRRYPDGRMNYPYSSKGIERMFGVTQKQAREDATAVFATINPDDLAAVAASIEESASRLSTWSIQFTIRGPERSWLAPLINDLLDIEKLVAGKLDINLKQQPLQPLLEQAVTINQSYGAQREITIELAPDIPETEIFVDGQGVPEAFRDQIFQRFAQADSSDTRSQGGTGLGLAITRELITAMAGEVGFESVPGQGATFWIRLPLASDDP